MEIKEAINVLKKHLICLKQFTTNLDKCDDYLLCEDCSHFVPSELLQEAIETIIEYFEGEKNEIFT